MEPRRLYRVGRAGFLALAVSFGATAVGAAPPDAPVLVGPDDASGGVPALAPLAVTVTDPDADPLTVRFFGRVAGTAAPDFTLVVLPDTQYYSEAGSPTFRAQTEWIVANKDALNVVYVPHLGDCVQNGDNGGNNVEWVLADDAIGVLEDPFTTMLADGLPYGIAVGNHDQSPFGYPGTMSNQGASTVLYNQFFGVSRFAGRAYYGGHWGTNNDNHYDLFSASGMDFIVVYLEYDQSNTTLRQSVIAWADGLLETFSDRRAIIVSHYILQQGQQGPFGPLGQAVYDALKDNPNLFLMLGGHRPGEGRRQDTFAGNTVDSVLADYQSRANGGDGWLRILHFSPANDEIHVQTYSPTLDQFETDQDSDFVLSYDMVSAPPFVELGSLPGVASGANAEFPWTGRAAGTTYEWRALLDDGSGQTTGPIWTFTSDGSCAAAPDCEDGDVCTDHLCEEGFCNNDVDPACCHHHVECNDSDVCTTDSCVANVCQNPPTNCGDQNPCTDDSCSSPAGCQHVADNNNLCDDGLVCTGNDQCSSGSCIADDTCPSGQLCDSVSGVCEVVGGAPLPIVEGEIWRYFKGTTEPPSNWSTVLFDDSAWLSGPSGFGYGDGDDGTLLTDMQNGYLSVYVRHLFEVPDPLAVFGLRLYVDFDDGYVAYLNGIEVARSNVNGNPPPHDRRAQLDHEAGTPLIYNLDPFVPFLTAGVNVLSAQGHNEQIGSSDLSLMLELVVTCNDAVACTTDTWNPSVGCQNTCDDADPCTTGDACDGNGVCSGSAVGPTLEVEDLLLNHDALTTLSWLDQGPLVRYDVATGSLFDVLAGGGSAAAECLIDDDPIPSFTDSRLDPLPESVYYYLVRAQNDCEPGPYGFSSTGAEHVPAVDCP